MEVLRLNDTNIQECVARAAEVIRAGGVVLYPTDTLYGLGADVFSDEAVAKVYEIKYRDTSKPIHCIVSDLEMAERYVEVGSATRTLAQHFLPGALTIILPKKSGVETGIGRGKDTIGIRIPKNNFCLALAREVGPFTTSSANIAGEANNRSVEMILAQLGERAEGIDLVVDAGELPESKPSTVVDLSGLKPEVLREGAVSLEALAPFIAEGTLAA